MVAEGERDDVVGPLDERGEGLGPAGGAELVGHAVEVAPRDDGLAPVERVGVGGLGHAQLDVEAEAAEERRGERKRVHRGAHVVREAARAAGTKPSAEVGLGLEHEHLEPGPCACHRRRETSRSRPDDDDVGHV